VLAVVLQVLQLGLAAALERLGEMRVYPEAAADPRRVGVRPGEDAVGTPNLDTEDVGAAVHAPQGVLRRPAIDREAIAVDELAAQDAVDVLSYRRLPDAP
jgi:hypothetical protein